MTNPWFKFYPTDWKADNQLKLCSAASRGLWIEMLCICHDATPYGHFLIDGSAPTETELSVLTGIPTEQITTLIGELSSRGIFSRTSKGVIYSRKMVKDEKKSREGKKHVKKRWNEPPENKEENPLPNRSPSSPPKTQKPEARKKDYVFEGKVIRLVAKDFDDMVARSRMSDTGLAAWLDKKDEWLNTLAEHERADWWHRINYQINAMGER